MLLNIVSFIIILVCAVSEMATDVYLPSLPAISEFFGVTEETAQQTLGWNLFGMGIAGLFWGPLSDIFGRRIIMILGMALFTFSSFMCIFVSTIHMLIFWRTIQGMGAAVSIVLGTAIVRDLYREENASRLMSIMGSIVAISPAIAPTIGGVIATFWDWHANFILVFIMAVICLFFVIFKLPETLKVEKRLPLRWKILKKYKVIFKNGQFFGYSLLSSLSIATLWGYSAAAPFIFYKMGIKNQYFGMYNGLGIIGYILGTVSNQFMIRKIGLDKTLFLGINICLLGSVIMLSVSYLGLIGPNILILGVIMFAFGMGYVFSNATVRATDVAPSALGAAVAFLNSLEMLAGALAIIFIGDKNNSSVEKVAYLVMATASIQFILFIFINKRYRKPVQS